MTTPKFHTAVKKAAEDMTLMLKQEAQIAGWPSGISAALSIDEVDGSLEITYPDSIKAQVEDLEYGTHGGAPNAILRPFISKHGADFDFILDEATVEVTSELGVFN